MVQKNMSSQYAIELKNITKTFLGGKIIANEKVNMAVKYNEIHAICGENGAGKSTLMSILFGLYKQDSGDVYVKGKKVNFKNAMEANKAGLGMVHQHFKLVQVFSLLDNIILGAESTKRGGFLDYKTSIEKIKKICQTYNFHIDLNMKTSLVSVGQQQRTEIIKLLYRQSDILIFDEPTAILSDDEIAGFLQMLRVLKKEGKTIILITHKLNEVEQVADRVTILRKGKTVGTYNMKDVSQSKITELMVGTKVIEKPNLQSFAVTSETLLKVENLHLARHNEPKLTAVKNLSFHVNPGEILGIAGIEGNGQTELALALAGLQKVKGGKITFKVSGVDIDITHCSPKTISNLGLSHVPEDRHKYGCVLDESVAYNLVSNQIDNKLFSKFGFLRLREISLNAIDLCSKFNILGANQGRNKMRSLSGGNQQKVVVAREMSKNHSLIVLVQPTRGLDVGAINSIHELILAEAKKGKGVILISYELDEILKIASRILVMDHGEIVYEAIKTKTNRQIIGQYLSRAVTKQTNKGNREVQYA